MAFIASRNAYVRIGSKNVSPFSSNFDMKQTVGALDTTVYGVNYTQFISGVEDVKIDMTMLFDNGTAATDLDATLESLLRTDGVRWDIMPEGSATGRILYSGSGIVTAKNMAGPVAGVVGMTVSLQNSGTVTRSLAA